MTRAHVLERDVFPCFQAGLLDDAGQAVNAEISAVAWDGQRLIMASDKPIPGDQRSAVFALECEEGRPQADTLVYYTAPLIRSALKYEDFALTVAGDHIVATTGFDRFSADDTSTHQYNQLLVWPSGHPESVRIVADTEDDGVDSSVGLRKQLSELLGVPYFKIEGLACLPGADGGDDLLVFGIREIGQNYADFDYAVCLVGVPYRMDGDDLVLTGDCRVLYDFDPTGWPGVDYVVGVSSLEYDPHNHRLFILTSFEVEDDAGNPVNGGYLWVLSMTDFHARKNPALVEDDKGAALQFVNKAEGLAVLSTRHVLIAYDPDRHLALGAGHERATREPHEAPYTLLAID